MEATLTEVGQKLDELGSAPGAESEHFAELLAATASPIGSATAEAKRQALRDLLVNAAARQPTPEAMEASTLALRLLEQIEAPGLEILAKVGVSDHAAMIDTGVYPTRVVRSFDELNTPSGGKRLSYGVPIVIEWVHRLGELRTIRFSEPIRQKLESGGTRATAGFSELTLTTLGHLLLTWAETPSTSSASAG